MVNDRLIVWGPGEDCDAELVAWQLWELGATAIEERIVQHAIEERIVQHAIEERIVKHAIEERASALVELVAGFADRDAFDVALTSVAGCREVLVADDGRAMWKQFAKPYVIDGVAIVPAWCDVPVEPCDIVVIIDPMDAFGLEHITTRTCIELMRPLITSDVRVLDVGCGSGVLSVVAARLGARRVVAIDHDPLAIAATLHNVEVNDVGAIVQVLGCDLVDLTERFDFVIANLGGTEIMLRLNPALMGAVSRDGMLCLSGMLAGSHGPVVDAFAWRAPPRVMEREQWAFVIGGPALLG